MENLKIFGLDTETYEGKPISLQVEGPDNEPIFIWTDTSRILEDFWSYARERIRPKGVNIFYVHNLNFDLRVIFWKYHLAMYEQFGDIKFTAPVGSDMVAVKMIFGKVNKADMSCGPLKLSLYCSKAFTQASLAKSLKMLGVPTDKFAQPEDLGHIDFSQLPRLDPRRIKFEEYARQDAHAERLLGLRIMDFHKLYDIRPAISLPSYAARVFRRHFMSLEDTVPFPGPEISKAAELSYHGGKNGYYSSRQRIYEDLYEVDISSAYPFAMSCLPNLTKGKYYRTEKFTGDYIGIYCISGEVLSSSSPRAKYPLVYDHGFKPVKGVFKDLWHTHYETAHIITNPQLIRVDSIWGYVWMHEDKGVNPFAKFVQHFYEKKQSTPKKDPNYHFYKIVLNALYGKLVSTIEVKSISAINEEKALKKEGFDIPDNLRIDTRYDPVLKRDICISRSWRAGSLYNPFLASLITGHTRAYLYKLETELEAVHSATDSVKTRHCVEALDGLGGLKVECFGRCYIFRNKLYLHFSRDGKYCGHTPDNFPYRYPKKLPNGSPHPRADEPMLDHDGQHLCKVAMHGYKGPLWMLFDNRMKLIRDGYMDYTYTHVVGLREGLRRGKTPCNFLQVEERLDLRVEQSEESDLLSFVKRRGGINFHIGGHEGELSYFTYKECRMRGIVTKCGGLPLGTMAEICHEAGYLREYNAEELLNKLRDSLLGRKYYSTQGGAYYEPEELTEEYYEQSNPEGGQAW